MFSTLGLYALPFIASLVTAKVMKIYGRKYLIQIGTGICGICLAVVAIAFIFKGDKN
jgi:small neutral amino acid transporter SnatA (MarC family)